MENNQISLNPSLIARALGAVALLLILASFGVQLMVYLTGHDYIYGLVPLFHVDYERNIPTGFSVLLLLFAALLLAVITGLERSQAGSPMFYWASLSFGFLFMAADEGWSFHERLVRPVKELFRRCESWNFLFRVGHSLHHTDTYSCATLFEILVASSCEYEARVLDGRKPIHWRCYWFGAYRGDTLWNCMGEII